MQSLNSTVIGGTPVRHDLRVWVRHLAGVWYATAEGHGGIYWHDSEDGAVEEAMLWASMLRPAVVLRVDQGKRSVIARYGATRERGESGLGGQDRRGPVPAFIAAAD